MLGGFWASQAEGPLLQLQELNKETKTDGLVDLKSKQEALGEASLHWRGPLLGSNPSSGLLCPLS